MLKKYGRCCLHPLPLPARRLSEPRNLGNRQPAKSGHYSLGRESTSLRDPHHLCCLGVAGDHYMGTSQAMTNPDRVLKSRDITLLIKVHIVKAVFFPIVSLRCESWTLKKAEC